MSRKKNVYNQVKRGAKRYKKAKAGKKGRVAVFAAVAIILAAIGVSQKDIGRLEQAADKVLDAYETVLDAGTSREGAENSVSETSESGTAGATGTGANVYVDLAAIPAYSGEPYAVVNGNIPYFTDSDMTSESFEYYSDLDELGRCGTAYSSVGTDLMPTEKRGSISKVKPSGWQVSKYDFVDGKYLYNRCHLIGYQLTGENANNKNLITGTRYLNVEGMLPFENMVADYVKETGNHVMYRVTPVFDGNNLLASGVLMEAKSVEDNGAGILFNVFCYNVQPGVTIDYATGDSALDGSVSVKEQSTPKPEVTQAPVVTTPTPQPEQQPPSATGSYVVNAKNGKIHIVGACPATGTGDNAMTEPVYFNTYEEAESYSISIAPNQSKRKCGNCYR